MKVRYCTEEKFDKVKRKIDKDTDCCSFHGTRKQISGFGKPTTGLPI